MSKNANAITVTDEDVIFDISNPKAILALFERFECSFTGNIVMKQYDETIKTYIAESKIQDHTVRLSLQDAEKIVKLAAKAGQRQNSARSRTALKEFYTECLENNTANIKTRETVYEELHKTDPVHYPTPEPPMRDVNAAKPKEAFTNGTRAQLGGLVVAGAVGAGLAFFDKKQEPEVDAETGKETAAKTNWVKKIIGIGLLIGAIAVGYQVTKNKDWRTIVGKKDSPQRNTGGPALST